MRVDNRTGKGTSGMDKFSGKGHTVHMELAGGKLLNSLRIKTQFLERLQSMSVGWSAGKDYWSQRQHSFMVHYARV
jgi:hypothetical protein